MFISHHLEELPLIYWEGHLGTSKPNHGQVIELLILRSKWDDEEVYDFTLPDEVTNYVVSVSFDENEETDNISMKS